MLPRTRWMMWLVCAVWLAACGTAAEKKPDEKPGGGGEVAKVEDTKPKVEVSEDAKVAFQDAIRDYRHQQESGNFNYESLIGSFERALDEDPKLAEAHYNIGCIYEAMHRAEDAVKHYKKALEIRPDLTLAAANWGALLAGRGKLDQALLVYKKALSNDSKNSVVLLNMAAIYRKQKQYDLALKRASEVLIRDPENVGAYRIMASLYYDQGDLDMAHLICLRGLQVKEKDPRLLNTLGLVLEKMGRVPEALAQFRAALDQVPDMIPTRFNVAKIALDYKDFRVAKGEFERILQYEPDNRKASIGLGITMRGLGEHDAAKAHFEAIAQRHPKDPLPHFWLGELALKNFNKTDEAMEEYKKFVELSGSRLPADHPVYDRVATVKKNIQMEKQMKEMEKKMQEEEKRRIEHEKQLADRRKKLVDEAWNKAKEAEECLPPAKLEGDKLPFVLIPLTVPPDKKTKVSLTGMEWKPVKKVEIGTLKTKWRQADKYTLEMIAPKGLGLGAWDVMVTFKDRNEDPMLFQGGLWVCKTPPKPKKPPEDTGKKGEKEKKGKKPDDKKELAPPEPSGDKGVKEPEGKGKDGVPAPLNKEEEPQEPEEPKDPGP